MAPARRSAAKTRSRPPDPVHVGSRVQKLRDAGESVRLVTRRFMAGEPMKSRIRSVKVFVTLETLDIKIGAVPDRPTQRMHITCVCRT